MGILTMSPVKTGVSHMGLPKILEDATEIVWLRSGYVWEQSCEAETAP